MSYVLDASKAERRGIVTDAAKLWVETHDTRLLNSLQPSYPFIISLASVP
jgi:hypothetical protein